LSRNLERSTKQKGSEGVRSEDYRYQSEERVIEKSARKDGYLVKAKQDCDQRGGDGVQAEKRRERDENSDGEGKRRSFGWIIDSEQTAKRGTKHNTLLKAVQRLGFVVERVEHG